ncbi:hypothetical protein DL771_007636 [Monosporascus sp. 5C6A]|nr:hypothetical protein DL771_007636 [Monosporascus sp. 5C6A]
MDPLSATASVIAVLQFTGEVIKYLNDVKDASKECQQCTIEASNLQNLLISLRYRLERGQTGDPWFTAVRTLNVENGPLDQYKQALEQLQSKVKNDTQRMKTRLAWKFTKAEVAGILARMERLKSHVNIMLEMDNFKLLQATKTSVDTTHTTVSALHDTQYLQRHDEIMQWLSPTDFPAQQHDIISRKQEGTGQWFLDSAEFKGWLQGLDKTLFCPGIPGAGKTMMAAIAIDHLCRTAQCHNTGVAYLFCNYKAQANQSAPSLLAALLKQLVQSRPDIAAPMTRIYDHHSKRIRPSLDDISGALQSACSSYTAVHIVVDALDECADKDGERGRLINKLRELQATTDVRLLFTSRFMPEITQNFQSNAILEVCASEEDVRRFVEGQMPRLPNCIQRDQQLKNAVQNKIVEAVDGMTKRKVLCALDKLSKGSTKLDEAYGEAIKRIDGQLAEDRSLARRALSWISYAQRLLTTEELCYALAIEPGDNALNDDNVYDVEDVISVCAGLVTVDEESSIIRLVHYTTQEYFERVRLGWHPSAQEEIAVACLTYLSFDTFRSGSCASNRAFERRIAENAFFGYSAHYWSEHVRPMQSTTSPLALAFLRDEALVDSTAQGALTPGYSGIFPSRTSGLHLTATYGLLLLTERLLVGKHGDSNIGADSKDSYGQTPLSLAARRGQEALVRLLVERDDVDADSKDRYGRTPLLWAAREGYEAVVKLLLEQEDVKADSADKDHRTPLSWAAGRDHEAVVRLLVERDDVDADSKNRYGRTPLLWAAREGYEGVVKLLLEREDVKADSADRDYRTPLSWAAGRGHEAVVRLLVERDNVDADSKDRYGRTPLLWAAREGYEAVVKLLFEREDVKADSADGDYRTPLSWAAGRGHEAVVRLLVERDDVDADSKDRYDRTPLLWAAREGYKAVVKLLLEREDVEADLTDKEYRTPLSWAAEEGYEAVVRLLLEKGADPDSKSNNGRTPLSLAAGKGYEAVVRLLFEKGADPDSKSNNGRTPLSLAAGKGYETVVRLLLVQDAVNPNQKDNICRTPLFYAIANGHERLSELLLADNRVEGNSSDCYGSTVLSVATGPRRPSGRPVSTATSSWSSARILDMGVPVDFGFGEETCYRIGMGDNGPRARQHPRKVEMKSESALGQTISALLNNGADSDVYTRGTRYNMPGSTPLSLACVTNTPTEVQINLVEIFFAYPIEINAPNHQNRTLRSVAPPICATGVRAVPATGVKSHERTQQNAERLFSMLLSAVADQKGTPIVSSSSPSP